MDLVKDRLSILHMLLEHLPIRVFWKDHELRYLGCNTLFARDAGLSHPDELIGKTDFDMGWRDQAEIYRADDRRVMESGISKLAYEEPQSTTEGRTSWLRTSKVPLRDKSDNVIGILGMYEDITDQRETQGKLRDSESSRRTLLEQLPLASQVLSPDGTTRSVNQAWETLWGVPFEALAKYNLFEDRQLLERGVIPELRRAFAGESVLSSTMEYDRAATPNVPNAGSKIIVRTIIHPVLNESGEVQEVVLLQEDLTRRLRAEMALKSSSEFLEQIIAHAAEGISVCHATDTFPHVAFSVWNDRMTEITGYTRDEINRLGWYQSMYPDPALQQRAMARMELMREGLNLQAEEWEVRTKSGDRRILSISTSLVTLQDGIPEVVGLMHDITERRRAEKEQQRLQDQLSATQRLDSVGRLAGGVAHDFNNMLSVILGRTVMAMEELDPTHPALAELQEVVDAAQRSADLTRQLLAFGRRQTAAPVVIDLNEKVAAMLTMLRRIIGEDIELAWRPACELAPIKMDPSQIDQILANLCVNAREAIDGVGNVQIETATAVLSEEDCARIPGAAPGEFAMLRVSDDGCGMHEEVLEHIFEPFFTTKGGVKSTGLGLATVYGIVKQNGGHVEVSSNAGLGTTFRIYLPTSQAKSGSARAAAPKPAPQGGTETLLLVEDEPTLLRMTSQMLQRLGYQVLAADAPAEAIRLTQEHSGPIDLLLTDVIMPEMSGWDLSRELLRLNPQLKLLFMSGYTAEVIAPRGVLDPGLPFIQKPFDRRTLAARLREILDPPR